MSSERDYNGMSTNTSSGTLTGRPTYLSSAEHEEAERQGWSVFQVDRYGARYGEVQRLDELELVDDDEAVKLARKMGLVVLDDGRVLARWHENELGLELVKIEEPLPMRGDGDGVDLLDEHLVEGLGGIFEQVKPEECGALTDGLILSREVERDDQGKLVKMGRHFWDSNYQVRNFWDDVDQRGRVTIYRGRD